MKNIFFEPQIFNQVIIILNEYSSFLNQKKIVTRLNEHSFEQFAPTQLHSMINGFQVDYYGEIYDEMVESQNHLSMQAIDDLNEQTKKEFDFLVNEFNLIKKKESNILILKEKKYKRLKHSFIQNYPSLIDDFNSYFSNFKSVIHNNNTEQKKTIDQLVKLTPSFISFFNAIFNFFDQRQHIAYCCFFNNVLKNNNINKSELFESTEFQRVINNIDLVLKNKQKKLPLNDILFLGIFFNKILSFVSISDISTSHCSIHKENHLLACSIVEKKIKKHFNLLNTFNLLEKKLM